MPNTPPLLTAEIIEPDEALPADLVALRRFAHLMDAAFEIPGTKRRFGLDAAIGLIPGVGDAVGALFSSWIVIGALKHRVPFRHIVRMMANIAVDVFVGAIPLAGDIFDFLWDENLTNLKLLLKHRNRQRPPRSFAAIASSIAVVLLLVLGMIVAAAALFIWLIVQVVEGRG
ncbi:MAG TPA: DUF4112 domain-containing protein [Thermoanaerobaculia bacterium]|nr:DUF4112 domain-containing protein [Thermoanaerobaculia bacterium]